MNNEETIYRVYCYTNSVNGKKYIGLTHYTLAKRAGGNGVRYAYSRQSKYGRYTYFYNAIRKYGWDAFVPEILVDDIPDVKTAQATEAYYINLFDTTNPEKGYNAVAYDEHGGMLLSEETKRKIGEHSTEYFKLKEARQAQSERRKTYCDTHPGILAGENHPMYGKHHSDESKEKLRVIKKEYYQTHDSPMKGLQHSEETKQLMSPLKHEFFESLTEEERIEFARAHFGEPKSGEEAHHYGLQHSEETKQRIRVKKLQQYADGLEPWNKGVPMAEDAKSKMIESKREYYETHDGSFKDHHHTDEARQKMSEGHKGLETWNKGKHMDAEYYENFRRAMAERTPLLGENNPSSKYTEEQITSVVNELITTTDSFRVIADRNDVKKSAIKNINRGQAWTHLTGATSEDPVRKPLMFDFPSFLTLLGAGPGCKTIQGSRPDLVYASFDTAEEFGPR